MEERTSDVEKGFTKTRKGFTQDGKAERGLFRVSGVQVQFRGSPR